MTFLAESSEASKLATIMNQLSTKTGNDLAAKFARTLFGEVDKAEFASYGVEDLTAFAAEALGSFRTRTLGEAKVVLRERATENAQFLLVDIVNDDMPFLLDSVLGQLREMGMVPELVAHPIFEVGRDAHGQLMVLSPAAPGLNGHDRESFIHLQIRKTGDERAAPEIESALKKVLRQVRTVVSDHGDMTGRLKRAIANFEQNPPPAKADTNHESLQFLRWLAEENFTFLGIREYDYVGDADAGELVPKLDSGLGLLRDLNISVLRRGGETKRLTQESRAFFLNSPPVIVAKANSKSTVHRRVHMDTIGVKTYGSGGQITGEIRFAGLFTANTYNHSTKSIPLLRLKVEQVSHRSGHASDSYSGRALLNVLETFPRDELFQISVEQLSRISEEILKIEFTPRPRVFVRRDEFGRFLSVFVYVPRERYSTEVRVSIVAMLEKAFNGRFESFTPFFPESSMVRIHFVIWRKDVELGHALESDLETGVEKIIRTWRDEFRDHVLQYYGPSGYALVEKYAGAFPVGYQESNRPTRALEDVRRLEKLGPDHPTDIDLYRDEMAKPDSLRATLQQLDEPITLWKRIPILKNFGFNVVSERTFKLTPKIEGQSAVVYLHDSDLQLAKGGASTLIARRSNLEEGFLAVWHNNAANDRFNGLLLTAGLSWRQAALMRAYAAYLQQSGAPYGLAYVSEVLNKHAGVARDLFSLFNAMFNPVMDGGASAREQERVKMVESITAKLDKILLLDEDRILRRFLALISSTLRTNFFQRGKGISAPETIAFKLRSSEIEWLPAPKPFAEIFVYSPRFEGVHLRGGPIARGGLRWSDRPRDFRTEILNLLKAQQVKNVVIIPRGAKGGFVPRKLSAHNRAAAQAEGIACYKSFVAALLSLTDNLVKGAVIPPADTVRRDGDDPYLVVAADKGTATFSDIANEIAVSRGFWLGDAFASGGSAGYDHKKMGITARGGWEAVKRHFREMNVDIQTTPFTVVGIGDMSGDVFGNGMLLSKALRLVAAFDHRDIFIDPNPDPQTSWEERKRLFDLPGSSWQSYDKGKLSAGGGIYSRNEKYIHLSSAAESLLGLSGPVTPVEVMTAILKAPADLLWFGGIGTYVRASYETDAQAGDKANDVIRVTGREIRAKVVGEGANLGMTQRARIEFALEGGRVNTDAIDNSAGVNTSDVEVNIKIAFNGAIASGTLNVADRNRLLREMTGEVATAVLGNNYLQTLAISLGEMRGLSDLGFQQRLIQRLENEGLLDRGLEALPSDAAIAERQAAKQPLTRPELAILLAYAKIDLDSDLIKSSVPDDPYLSRALLAYFPPLMRQRFAAEIESHPLRREIITTSLTNTIINRGGSTFVVRLMEETGQGPGEIAYAFASAMAVYRLEEVFSAMDALDGRMDGQKQLALYRSVQNLLRRQTAWFLRHGRSKEGLEPEIQRYRDGAEYLTMNLAGALSDSAKSRLKEQEEHLQQEGVTPELAKRISALEPLSQALDIVRVANVTDVPISTVAKIIYAIRDVFRLDDLAQASEELAAADYFDKLAVNSCLASLASAQRDLSQSIIGAPYSGDFGDWRWANEKSIARVSRNLNDILDGRDLTLARLTVAVAQLHDLSAA